MIRIIKIALILLLPIVGFTQSEIRLEGRGYEIIDGTNTWPDSTGQAFGVLTVGNSVEHTFWIFNEGISDLTVSTFTITAAYTPHFNITDPTSLVISAGDSISFTVEYKPTATGTHGRTTAGSGRANIQFTTNDADEATYNFSVSGAATPSNEFDCSSGRILFSANNPTDLFDWNYAEQPPTKTIIRNNWNKQHDGMAMNPNDNFIYAMRWTANNRDQLWVFDQSGEETFVGYVSGGLIASNMNPHLAGGTMDNDNNLYVFQNADVISSLKKINVRSQQAETITLSGPVHIFDAIYNPDDGLLYGFSAGATHDGLVSINPNTGTVNYIGGDGDANYHAMFRSTDGSVYMMTKKYSMYLVDLTDGGIEQIGTNPGWENGTWVDGCACGEIKAEADVSITVDDNRPSYVPGQFQTYTITVTNNGPWGAYRDTVRAGLPSGITEMSWTSTAYGAGVTDNTSGSGALEDVIDIGVGDSIVYRVKVTVPLSYTLDLTSTATVTASSVLSDLDLSNNAASDSDVIITLASEQCDNGFDDDGDGNVDCFDEECAGTSVCASHYTNGIIPDCPDTPDVALFSMREQFRRANVVKEGYCTPMVGDLDGDGIPEIVVHTMNKIENGSWTYGPNATIRVLNGQTGAVKHSVNVPRIHYFTHSTSIADVDKDGDGEIYIVSGDQLLRGFDHTLTPLLGFSATLIGQGGQPIWDVQKAAGVQFADFDQDGQTELFIGNQVFDALTGAILAEPPTKNDVNNWSKGQHKSADYMSAAADLLPDNFCATCSGLEIIAGNTVYAVDLTNPTANSALTVAAEITPTGTYTDGFTSIVDWDGDDSLDVVVTTYQGGASRVYVWNPRTQSLVTQDQSGNPMPAGLTTVVSGYQCGRATVADFDGDGVNELAIVSRNRLKLYESDLSLKWQRTDFNDKSSLTSATAFDFEGDGNVEVVYRDDNQLRILDGVTGATKASLGCSSGTRVEMPVIADVDADGQAEIAVTCGNDLVVYEADQTPWMPTRKVWNSLHYSPTFINDDLTIPAHRQDKASIPRLDIYAAQTYITDPSGAIIYPALPDFITSIDSTIVGSCGEDSIAVYLSICNDDANGLKYNYPISYYNGDPTAGGTLIGTKTVTISNTTFTKDSCYQVTFNVPNNNFNLHIYVNDDGTDLVNAPSTVLLECDITNNHATELIITCPTDAAITKTDNSDEYVPGSKVDYTIVAKNKSINFTGGIVSDPLPIGISPGDVTWTAVTYGGATTKATGTMSGALQDTVDIPFEDSIVYTVSIIIPPTQTGDFVNTATITVSGDTITNNNTATDTDERDCTFFIEGTVNSRSQSWTKIGSVVSGITYDFKSTEGNRTFTAFNGPENGQTITTVKYNNNSKFWVSLERHRYTNGNSYFGTVSSYDNTPHGWTGLSGTPPENAPVLGFMAFIDQNGNGTFDSGTEEYIRDINTLSFKPATTGELYMAFYDDGSYTDNNGLISISASSPIPSVSLGNDTTICSGDSVLLDAGYPTAASWVWNTGATTQTIQAKTAGEHIVVVTTASGCKATDTINVTLNGLPIINLRNDTSICVDDSLQLDAKNPTADSWVWSTGETTRTIEAKVAGQYSVIVTGANTCINNATITIGSNTQPSVSLGNDTTICATTILTLDAGNATSWDWIPTANSQTIQVSTDGDYSVEITDTNGCKDRDTISIKSTPLPVVNLGNDTAICAGDSIIINAGNGTGWTWNVPGNSQKLVVKTSNTYRVTTIDANTCEKSDTIIIDVNPIPVMNLGKDTNICMENQYTLDAENTGATYLWSTGSTDPTIETDGAGTYEVIVTSEDNCIAFDTISIDTFATPIPNLNTNDTSICSGDTFNLVATADFANYEWTNNSSTTDTAYVFETNTIKLTVTSEDGCKASETALVTVNPIPEIGLDDSTNYCVYGPVLVLSVLESGADYVWSTGSTDQAISVLIAGKYWVDVTNDDDCFNTDTITIRSPSLVIDLGDEASICDGDSVILDAGNFAFEIWNSTDTSATFTVNQTDTVDVLAIDADGCFGRDTINITKNPNPTITIIQPDSAICDLIGETTTLSVANDEGMDINWNTGESGESITAIENGEFIATKTNEFACSSSDTVIIDRLCEEVTITLPNIFTPDGDGTNENFKPLEDPIKLLTYIKVINFIVYNRWGRVMYLSENLLPHWNGVYQDTGKPCPDGVYYWVMKYSNVQGEEKATNGYIQLLR